MKLTTTARFRYELSEESTLFFNFLASRHGSQRILSEHLDVSPKTKIKELADDHSGPRTLRVKAPAGSLELEYRAIVEVKPIYISTKRIKSVHLSKFDADILPYTFPSRYCPSDRMRDVAGKLFGQCKNPTETVIAISDWIYENLSYTPGVTFEQTAADEVFEMRKGVCRDFAHLGVTLCRALNIPARYVSVYAYNLMPMDFHACFEAWIGGKWIIFDPTHMASLNAVVRIATGMDAAYVAVATIFGNVANFTLSNDCTSDKEVDIEVRGSLAQKEKIISLG